MLPIALLAVLMPAPQSVEAFPHESFVPFGTQTVDEMHAGLLGDDLALDLVLRTGTALEYVHNAGSVATQWNAVAGGVVDSALLRGDGSAGSDSVAFTTDSGLLRLEKAAGLTGSFTVTAVPGAGTGWGGRRLYDAPWNGDQLVVGVGTADMRLARWDGSLLTLTASIGYSGTVYGVDTMDWDGDGSDELLALIDDRLDVYNAAGGLVTSFSSTIDDCNLAVSRAAQGRDVALWEVPLGSFSVVSALNSIGAVSSIVQGTPGGLVALDETGDGMDDLVRLGGALAPALPGDGQLFRRTGSGAALSSFSAFMDPAGGFTSFGSCHPVEGGVVVATVAGDFDNDSDVDFAMALATASEAPVRIRQNGRVNEVDSRLTWYTLPVPTLDAGQETATLLFYAPVDPAYFNVATHVRLRQWGRASVSTTTGQVLVPGAAQPEYQLLTHALPIAPHPGPTETFQLVAPVPVADIRIYAATMVELDGSGAVLSEGPTNVIYFVADETLRYELAQTMSLGCHFEADPEEGGGQINGGRGGYSNPPEEYNP